MADSQRAKARSLVDSDVMTLGRDTQKTRKTTNPVAQANMSRFGPANPQPRLTPKAIPFKKGGKVKMAMGGMPAQAQGNAYGRMGVMPPNAQGLANRPAMPMQAQGARPFKKGGSAKSGMKKAAQVAGFLSGLAGQPQGAPPAAPMAAAPMGAPGMKRGGKAYAKGGDVAQDKAMVKRGVHEHEAALHKGEKKTVLKLAKGGRATDDEGNRMNGMKRGGATHVPMVGMKKQKFAKGGGVSHVPERGEGNHKPDSGTGGNLVPRSKMARGGTCAKCGGAMSAKHMCGGGAMKKGGRAHFAMGGVGKIRHGVATPTGKPKPQKRGSYNDLI